MEKGKIISFAKELGYDGVLPLGKWNGYDAYEPYFGSPDSDHVVAVGPPLMVLVKGNEIRMSTVEEAFASIDHLQDEV